MEWTNRWEFEGAELAQMRLGAKAKAGRGCRNGIELGGASRKHWQGLLKMAAVRALTECNVCAGVRMTLAR